MNASGAEHGKYILKLHDWDLCGTPLKVDIHGCLRYFWTRVTCKIKPLEKKEVLQMLIAFIFPTVTIGSVEGMHQWNLSGRDGYKTFEHVMKLLHYMTGYALLLDHSYSVLDIFHGECGKISIASKKLKFASKDGMRYRFESVILRYECSYGSEY